jgi:hypothetical protein
MKLTIGVMGSSGGNLSEILITGGCPGLPGILSACWG